MPWVKALFCQEAKTYNTCRIKWSELKTISLSRITPDNLVNNTMVQPSTSRMKIVTFLSYSVFDEHSSSWEVICCQGKQKWSELKLRRLWVERYEHVDLQLRRQAATENSQMRTVGLYNIGALWRWSTFASCFVFGEVGELICSVGSLSPELQRLR